MRIEWSYKPIEKLEDHFKDEDLLAIVKEFISLSLFTVATFFTTRR